MSYSRYFPMATPIDTGQRRDAEPGHAADRAEQGRCAPWRAVRVARTRHTMLMAAPLASHFSCWRRSPVARRQLSACRAMKTSDSAVTPTASGPWIAPYQPVG